MSDTNDQDRIENEEAALPFAAPCRQLPMGAPLQWLKRGWQDLRTAPAASLGYGVLLVLSSWLIAYLALTYGNVFVLLAFLSGFVFMGPVVALAFYDISAQLEQGGKPTLFNSLAASLRHVSNEAIFAVFLIIIFLVWARAASMTHIFFPAMASTDSTDMLLFLGIGSVVGSLFAAFIFCISAFSLPMIIDRRADMVTAAVTSFNAVLRNKPAMFVWVLLIVAAVGVGVLTGFLGLAVTLPLIGHATWHAYRDTIDASAWPRHGE